MTVTEMSMRMLTLKDKDVTFRKEDWQEKKEGGSGVKARGYQHMVSAVDNVE